MCGQINHKNILNSKKLTAFTLAEVLVTITIVGIVVALTIPTVVQNIQEQRFRTAWKKNFSTISNVLNLLQIDNTTPWDMLSSADMKNQFKKHLVYLKDNNNATNIFPPIASYSFYEGGLVGAGWSYAGAGLVLNDGTFISFFSQTNCGRTYGTLTDICGYICVDINGNNLPNMQGKDMLYAWIVKNPSGSYKLLASGAKNETICSHGSNTTYSSQGCSYLMLYDKPMP